MNVAAGSMPPFGLLDVAESTGLDSLNPEAVSTSRLIDALTEDIPAEQLAPARVEAVLSMSGDLASRNPMLQTWFEDNEDVRRVLSERTTKKKQRAALITGPLESRRDYWTQVAAWTAFAMKNQVRTTDWQDFAILARELASGRPLAEIPLMHVIADATIAVHSHVAARG
jgi:hypothetical protein